MQNIRGQYQEIEKSIEKRNSS
ncbi:TPA: hypothetical protein ANIA_11589 [Aspergillus nidulans FGSC A4]|uniref:Uncharacterized protein n=1 Tax=Emericella nidulans (strain FGSC A4 / ATCC 38163 / CBS 112.46 / NRRL 194 / M139) TaxID=227321 RepID=C8V6W1_EMENI|nr:TPA: hypothetical protein ANIA_11589 [Aspergillus nidulans FGSC A4]